MYIFNSRIRYSESDSEGKLTMASLLNYFQDCSNFQSEDLGIGVDYLKEHHMVWVLASWQIVVERYPNLCDEVEIGTCPYEFKKFIGMRNFFMRTKEGEYLAKANSLWTLLDTESMKPTNPPKEMLERYQISPKLDMEYASRKVLLPDGGEHKEQIVVKKHHLDTNHHVNNGQFVDMAMDFIPEDYPVDQLRVEYKKQAWLDEILYPYVVSTENSWLVSLRDNKESPFVNIEFKKKS